MNASIWLLLAAVTALVAALHLVRPPARRIALPSTVLWVRALARTHRLRAPWRRWLALALALVIAWSLLLALPGPGSLLGGDATRTVLILDTSRSMAARTRDGRTRFEHAREGALRLIDALPPTAEAAILDTTGSFMPTGFVTPREARAALARMQPGTDAQAALPPLPDAAVVHAFTDGVALEPAVGSAIVHSVFEPADNVAITAFDVRALPQQPTQAEALVQLINASPGSRRVQVILRGSGDYRVTQPLDLDAGESVDITVDVSAYRGDVLAAAAALEGDAYAADDIAYAAVPAHEPVRVLLVSGGNAGLEDALRSLPGIVLAVRAPARFDPTSRYDAYVFDRFAPPAPPAAPSLLMRPPVVTWLGNYGAPVAGGRVLRIAAAHPAVDGLPWGAAPVTALRSVNARTGEAVLLRAQDGAPAAVAFDAPVRGVTTGFAWNDAPPTLQAHLPVFLGNAIGWLTGGRDVVRARPGTVELPLPDAQIRDGGGAPVAARTVGARTVFDADRPDVFTVTAGARTTRVVVQPADPRHAQINRTALPAASASASIAAPGTTLSGAWPALVLLACVLLAVDWLLYARRVTA